MESNPTTFGYRAQAADGAPFSGTLDAASSEEARQRLGGLGLRVVEIEAAPPDARAPGSPRGRALRGEDFLAFNQQLAQLTAAGLPLEGSLRLIAQDMRGGRLAQTVREVAAELEKGRPMAEAFAAHRGRFPPLYGRLIEAGARTGRLPGMLLSLGRHLELLQRMRAIIWQSLAYPIIILVAILLVTLFMSVFVLPQFEDIFRDFGTELPILTRFVLTMPLWLPWIVGAMLLMVALSPLVGRAIHALSRERPGLDRFVMSVPLIGPVLRNGLLARWCDAVRLGVDAGLDLPSGLELASDATGSSAARADAKRIGEALAAGRIVTDTEPCYVVPPSVLAAIGLAAKGQDLGSLLDNLAQLYRQKTELRLTAVQAFLTPVLLVFLAVGVGFIVLSLLLPLVKLVTSLT